MPHSYDVSWSVHDMNFPPHTPVAADYLVSTDAPDVSEIQVPYAGPYVCEMILPEGHWTVTAQLQEPDGSMLGAKVSATVDVPGDDVIMAEPAMLTLTLVPEA